MAAYRGVCDSEYGLPFYTTKIKDVLHLTIYTVYKHIQNTRATTDIRP